MADPVNAETMTGLVQPCEGASMIPHSSVVKATIEMLAPTGSSFGAAGSFDSGTSGRETASVAATNGTLTRNTEPHQKCSSRKPPVTGPITIPSAETPAQIPIAFARSCAGKTFVRIERVEGMMNAAPAAIRLRLAISISELLAKVALSEPSPKTIRPSCSARLRPKRSPRLPAVRRIPAKTSM
jgi:hypothetical protein